MSTDTRALDVQIHEQVMGHRWDETRCRVCGWPLTTNERTILSCTPGNCSQRPVPSIRADAVPSYSTNIGLAWMVVEHLQAQGWWLSLIYRSGDFLEHFDKMMWFVEFRGGPKHRSDCYASAATPAEAICLVALKTVGEVHDPS